MTQYVVQKKLTELRKEAEEASSAGETESVYTSSENESEESDNAFQDTVND